MTQPVAATVPAQAATRLVHHAGALVPLAQATVPVGSIAMRYGVSVFEGVRLYRQRDGDVQPWLLREHLERLAESCRLTELDAGACAEVPGIVDELVRVNRVADDAYCRIAVSAGNAGGIDAVAEAVLTVSVTPMARKRWLAEGRGMRLTVSPWQRTPNAAFPSAAKNISNYAGPRLAAAQARREGYDGCVLVTGGGLVSEAPTAALFVVTGGRLVTPRLADDVLPSITRAWVLAVAERLGFVAEAGPVTPDQLRDADEAFLCGTGIEFGPVAEVDGRRLRSCPGPVTSALVAECFRQARGDAPAPDVAWQRG